MELHDLDIQTAEQFLDWLNDFLEYEGADMVTRTEYVADPGFVLVKLHSGAEFIVRAQLDLPAASKNITID